MRTELVGSILLLLVLPTACLAQTPGTYTAPAATLQQAVDSAEVQKKIDYYLSLDDFEQAAGIAVTRAHFESIRAAKKVFTEDRKERKRRAQEAKAAIRCASPSYRAANQANGAVCPNASKTAVAPVSGQSSD